MAISKRRITLAGSRESTPLLYPPHHVNHLPEGVHSILTSPNLFEDNLVVFAPVLELFQPPLTTADTRALLREVYGDGDSFWQVDGDNLLSAYTDDPDDDEDLLADDWDANTSAAVLQELARYGLWVLDQCFAQGRVGKQYFFVFFPMQRYEPYCTGALFEQWLGLGYDRGRTVGTATVHSTPVFDSSFLASILDPAELYADPALFEPGLSDFEKGNLHQAPPICSYQLTLPTACRGNIGPRIRQQSGSWIIFPWEVEEDVMRETGIAGSVLRPDGPPMPVELEPLLVSADGRDIIGSRYTCGQMELYLLPEFPDLSPKIDCIVKELFDYDQEAAEKQRAQLLIETQPRIQFPEQREARPLDGSVPGPKKGHGWLVRIEGSQIALPERQFLYLLAFIVAAKVGQANGLAPQDPRIGRKKVRDVFTAADGSGRKEGGNPARPKRKLAEALKAAGVELPKELSLVVSSGTQDYRYKLNPVYPIDDISLLPLARSNSDVVEHLLSFLSKPAQRSESELRKVDSSAWYRCCDPQITDASVRP